MGPKISSSEGITVSKYKGETKPYEYRVVIKGLGKKVGGKGALERERRVYEVADRIAGFLKWHYVDMNPDYVDEYDLLDIQFIKINLEPLTEGDKQAIEKAIKKVFKIEKFFSVIRKIVRDEIRNFTSSEKVIRVKRPGESGRGYIIVRGFTGDIKPIEDIIRKAYEPLLEDKTVTSWQAQDGTPIVYIDLHLDWYIKNPAKRAAIYKEILSGVMKYTGINEVRLARPGDIGGLDNFDDLRVYPRHIREEIKKWRNK